MRSTNYIAGKVGSEPILGLFAVVRNITKASFSACASRALEHKLTHKLYGEGRSDSCQNVQTIGTERDFISLQNSHKRIMMNCASKRYPPGYNVDHRNYNCLEVLQLLEIKWKEQSELHFNSSNSCYNVHSSRVAGR